MVPDNTGSTGTRYSAELLGGKYALLKEELAFKDEKSRIVSNEHIDRLGAANIFVVISSKSGAGFARTAYTDILLSLFNAFSISSTEHQTSSKTSHQDFLSSVSLSSTKENIIVLLGGDTILYDFLNALPQNTSLTSTTKVTIVPIPCGTGNALAMSLGTTSIPTGIAKLFGVGKDGNSETKPLPLLKITIKGTTEKVIWGAVVCSWGLHASLVADSDAPEMRAQYGPKRFAVNPFRDGLIVGGRRTTIDACAACVSRKTDNIWC